MNVYYTDELGRTRCFEADSSERYSVVAKHNYHAINSVFSSYSSHFSQSRLHSTHCPVCSADVFFCECDNGGRVFFDSLAPTWKKHPCTTNYESGNRVKTYHLIHPKENHFIKEGEKSSKKIVMEVPDFMTHFELSINKSSVYDNLINNCTLMVRQQNGMLLLTIIVNNKKFKNEYLCNDKEFSNQRDLENFIESVLWDTDLSVSMKIKKKENEIKSHGDHKIIQISKQNAGKVLTTLAEQKKILRLKKEAEQKEEYAKERGLQKRSKEEQEAIRKQRYEEYIRELDARNSGIDPDSIEKQFLSKSKGLTIVKKKNVLEKPIAPVPEPRDDSKMSLDQFGSAKEALRAIRYELQKQLDEESKQ